MKIACLSDIHGQWKDIEYPQADILVLAGDILNNYIYGDGTHGEVEKQLDELSNLNDFFSTLKSLYKEIILVAGNHDWCFEKEPEKSREIITNAIYLQDEEVVVDNVKFYGSPWQPWFHNWAFNFPNPNPRLTKDYSMAEVEKEFGKRKVLAARVAWDTWDKIPKDTNVLITHGPPFKILDETIQNTNAGCVYLGNKIARLSQLKAHIFGHIHHAYGRKKIGNKHFVNAAGLGESYKDYNPIQVIEV